MILIINTGCEKNFVALMDNGKIIHQISWQMQIGQSQKLLAKLNQLVKKNKIKLADLKAIAVYQGPGSYTGLRVGITVANTLAWSLNIDIVAFNNTSEIAAIIKKFQSVPNRKFKPISPKYEYSV